MHSRLLVKIKSYDVEFMRGTQWVKHSLLYLRYEGSILHHLVSRSFQSTSLFLFLAEVTSFRNSKSRGISVCRRKTDLIIINIRRYIVINEPRNQCWTLFFVFDFILIQLL